jgi:hypothetical protein
MPVFLADHGALEALPFLGPALLMAIVLTVMVVRERRRGRD